MQLEEQYYKVFAKLSSDLRDKWITILMKLYNEPNRHYHNLNHVRSMLDKSQSPRLLKLESQQTQILHLAIWFHDAIYINISKHPGSSEIQSIFIFQEFAKEILLVNRQRSLIQSLEVERAVKYLILCTIKHNPIPEMPNVPRYMGDPQIRDLFDDNMTMPSLLQNTSLTTLFLDLDRSILGTSTEEYDVYSKAIRQEYIHYPWDEYRSGRVSVLQGFLNRERLFFTDHFHAQFENIARENINREIRSLQENSE